MSFPKACHYLFVTQHILVPSSFICVGEMFHAHKLRFKSSAKKLAEKSIMEYLQKAVASLIHPSETLPDAKVKRKWAKISALNVSCGNNVLEVRTSDVVIHHTPCALLMKRGCF